MKLLLTSSGISNASIHEALVGLLGKPIAECDALFVPTGIYPFPGGAGMAWRAMAGTMGSPLCQLGWRSLGLLELTALTSIDRKAWAPSVKKADALLVWGGDPVFLSYWMQESGLAELLPSLRETVYVGVSAGSMATAATFAESYGNPPNRRGNLITAETIVYSSPQGEFSETLVTAHGIGLVDFAIIPHFEHEDHADASEANAALWAAKVASPVYAIDDNSVVKVVDGAVEVVSEGRWKLFNA